MVNRGHNEIRKHRLLPARKPGHDREVGVCALVTKAISLSFPVLVSSRPFPARACTRAQAVFFVQADLSRHRKRRGQGIRSRIAIAAQAPEKTIADRISCFSQCSGFLVELSASMLELNGKRRGLSSIVIALLDMAQPVQFSREHSVRRRLCWKRKQNPRASSSSSQDLGRQEGRLRLPRTSGLLNNHESGKFHRTCSLHGRALGRRGFGAVGQIESRPKEAVSVFTVVPRTPRRGKLYFRESAFDSFLMLFSIKKLAAVVL